MNVTLNSIPKTTKQSAFPHDAVDLILQGMLEIDERTLWRGLLSRQHNTIKVVIPWIFYQ